MTAPLTQDKRAEIINLIKAHCYVYIQSVDGKTLPTENIDTIEVRGIEGAADAITALQRGVPDGWQTEVLAIASDMEAVADTVSPRDGKKHPAPYMREQASKLRALLADKHAPDDTEAAKLYGRYTDNHPTIHSNRFPAWSELTDAQKQEWRERAMSSHKRTSE